MNILIFDHVGEAVRTKQIHVVWQYWILMRQSIVLRDAIYRANKIIFQTAQSKTDCEGMGTTGHRPRP